MGQRLKNGPSEKEGVIFTLTFVSLFNTVLHTDCGVQRTGVWGGWYWSCCMMVFTQNDIITFYKRILYVNNVNISFYHCQQTTTKDINVHKQLMNIKFDFKKRESNFLRHHPHYQIFVMISHQMPPKAKRKLTSSLMVSPIIWTFCNFSIMFKKYVQKTLFRRHYISNVAN